MHAIIKSFKGEVFKWILFWYWVSIKYCISSFPMDLWNLHRFDVQILRGKFVKITSILRDESTWKLWHRFELEISTWIRLSKPTKYRWVLHVDFSKLLRCRIDVTSVLSVLWNYFLTFSALGTNSELFWYSTESMWFQQYWRNHWYWNYWNYILWEFLEQHK